MDYQALFDAGTITPEQMEQWKLENPEAAKKAAESAAPNSTPLPQAPARAPLAAPEQNGVDPQFRTQEFINNMSQLKNSGMNALESGAFATIGDGGAQNRRAYKQGLAMAPSWMNEKEARNFEQQQAGAVGRAAMDRQTTLMDRANKLRAAAPQIEAWKKANPEHPMSQKDNWSVDEAVKFIQKMNRGELSMDKPAGAPEAAKKDEKKSTTTAAKQEKSLETPAASGETESSIGLPNAITEPITNPAIGTTLKNLAKGPIDMDQTIPGRSVSSSAPVMPQAASTKESQAINRGVFERLGNKFTDTFGDFEMPTFQDVKDIYSSLPGLGREISDKTKTGGSSSSASAPVMPTAPAQPAQPNNGLGLVNEVSQKLQNGNLLQGTPLDQPVKDINTIIDTLPNLGQEVAQKIEDGNLLQATPFEDVVNEFGNQTSGFIDSVTGAPPKTVSGTVSNPNIAANPMDRLTSGTVGNDAMTGGSGNDDIVGGPTQRYTGGDPVNPNASDGRPDPVLYNEYDLKKGKPPVRSNFHEDIFAPGDGFGPSRVKLPDTDPFGNPLDPNPTKGYAPPSDPKDLFPPTKYSKNSWDSQDVTPMPLAPSQKAFLAGNTIDSYGGPKDVKVPNIPRVIKQTAVNVPVQAPIPQVKPNAPDPEAGRDSRYQLPAYSQQTAPQAPAPQAPAPQAPAPQAPAPQRPKVSWNQEDADRIRKAHADKMAAQRKPEISNPFTYYQPGVGEYQYDRRKADNEDLYAQRRRQFNPYSA